MISNNILKNNQIRPSFELINNLGKDLGNSFYIFSKTIFLNNLLQFRTAFNQYYPNTELSYSFKTNYLPAACKITKEEGLLAEVVSELEYNLALKLGFDGSQIIFNGPLKEEKELINAFKQGSLIHFDSYSEIIILKKFLSTNPNVKVKCALRCNFDIGEEKRSRFGFDVESGEVEKVYKELFMIRGCLPIGIHCHFSTNHRSLTSYKLRTHKIIELSKKIFKEHTLEYIDVGGGFFGDMEKNIKNIFSFHVPTISEYGKEIGEIMKKEFPNEDIKLILEPGVSVIANTMCFICQVSSIKSINKKPIVTLSGGLHNIRPTGSNSNIPFIVIGKEKNNTLENALIGGYTCMETDIINESFNGNLEIGDFLLFDNMGAYNIVFKPPFIKESPPIIMISEKTGKTTIEQVRKRESLDDIFSTYVF